MTHVTVTESHTSVTVDLTNQNHQPEESVNVSPETTCRVADDEDVEDRPRPFHRHPHMEERGGHTHPGGDRPHTHVPHQWDD